MLRPNLPTRDKEPSTDPYPEADQSRPYNPNPVSLKSILILSSHIRLGLTSGLCKIKWKINYDLF
jgi:hypothetical protein